ncbi:MAG: hypothetical protein ACPG7F_06850 [Aggregatilineales bacterium]
MEIGNLIIPIIAIATLIIVVLVLFVIPTVMRRQERQKLSSGIRDTGEHPLRRLDTSDDLDFSDVPDVEIDWNAITHRSIRQHLQTDHTKAINAYRKFTGCRKSEAEAAVAYAIEHLESLPYDSHVINATNLDISLDELMRLRRLLHKDQRRDAIRLYCEFTGAGMRVGAEAIATIEAQL